MLTRYDCTHAQQTVWKSSDCGTTFEAIVLIYNHSEGYLTLATCHLFHTLLTTQPVLLLTVTARGNTIDIDSTYASMYEKWKEEAAMLYSELDGSRIGKMHHLSSSGPTSNSS